MKETPEMHTREGPGKDVIRPCKKAPPAGQGETCQDKVNLSMT